MVRREGERVEREKIPIFSLNKSVLILIDLNEKLSVPSMASKGMNNPWL